MKRLKAILIIVLGVGLLFSVCQADEKQKLSDPKEKESYSLGYQFGDFLKKQGGRRQPGDLSFGNPGCPGWKRIFDEPGGDPGNDRGTAKKTYGRPGEGI